MSTRKTRREFLKSSALSAAAIGLAGHCRTTDGQTTTAPASQPVTATGPAPASRPATQSAPATRPGPSERVVLGFIGVGGRGLELMNDFAALPDAQIAAVCDVDDAHLAEAVKRTGGKAKPYGDYRKLLERQDIHAVVIATPDHWHALTAVHAMHADKDVYIEKPLAHTVYEGRVMVDTARRHRRITQLGTQIHATENYRRVVEIVQSGILGKITTVRAWVVGNVYPGGHGKGPDENPPRGLNYDMWLGPAPQRPYNRFRLHFNWRWWWDYGGGVLGDMGSHLIDLVYWAMQVDTPLSVAAVGGRYVLQDDTETPDTLEAVYDFAPSPGRDHPFNLVWSHSLASGQGFWGRNLGVAFYGTNGVLVADYNTHEIHADEKRMEGAKIPPPAIPPSPGHQREFLDCVKSRRPCSCHVERSHKLATAVHLGNIALRTGRRLTWNGQREEFVNDPAANQLLRPAYRKPWEI